MNYESIVLKDSQRARGVQFRIARMSFARRGDVLARVRTLGSKLNYLQAGTEVQERLEARDVQQEIEAIYFRAGLAGIEGLLIDQLAATPELLWDAGPPELVEEALDLIRTEWLLTEDQRKNFCSPSIS